MTITWKIPADPPNPDAIARMRLHFPKPSEPMPEAWFMGKLKFFTELDGNSDSIYLYKALQEISSGIVLFSKVHYIPLWKEWFRYLLPDLILRANDPENLGTFFKNILTATISTFFSIYPDKITEEYSGFRDDVISTLGTRPFPYPVVQTSDEDLKKPRDIWDNFDFSFHEEVENSILFCLKYLAPKELEVWAVSLFQIESPQWYLQLIFGLSIWRNILRFAKLPGETKFFVSNILKKSGMLGDSGMLVFETFEQFIPVANIPIFEKIITQNLSNDLFGKWTSAILGDLNTDHDNIENVFYINEILEKELLECQQILFPKA